MLNNLQFFKLQKKITHFLDYADSWLSIRQKYFEGLYTQYSSLQQIAQTGVDGGSAITIVPTYDITSTTYTYNNTRFIVGHNFSFERSTHLTYSAIDALSNLYILMTLTYISWPFQFNAFVMTHVCCTHRRKLY